MVFNIYYFGFVRLEMSRYFCPFCSSRNQFHKTRSDGVLICGLCGDLLMKKPFVSARRIFGILLASAFLAPLLIMLIFVVNDFTKKKFESNTDSFLVITLFK